MLKLFPGNAFSSSVNAKCGEIYCHSPKNFTILCTLCELKTFDFEDFQLHFRNLHFENDVLKTEGAYVEVTPYLSTVRKEEVNTEEHNTAFEFLDEPDLENSDEEGDNKVELRLMKREHKKPKSELLDGKDENNVTTANNDDEDYLLFTQKRKRKHISTGYKCETCSREYKSAHNLRIHKDKTHNPDNESAPINQMQNCEECSEKFRTLRSLEEHSLGEHGGLKCIHCDKRYNSRTNQQRHLETHTHGTERRFVCDFECCTKRFFTRRQYQAHKRTHTKGKNFICDVCGYSCRETEMLKVHYRSHTGEKPYACNECGKSFVSSSAVKEHKASHGTERPHICNTCGRSFARAKSLYHHNFLHLDEKKFKCKLCGQAYAQLSGLAGHMRRHREDGLY